MEIIYNAKDMYNPNKITYPIIHKCECCGSELSVGKEDIKEGYLGMAYVDCPACHQRSYLEIEELDRFVSVDDLKFPNHFYQFSGKDAKELTSDEIKEYIKRAIEFFRDNPDNFCYVGGTGDTEIMVLNYPGDAQYVITVCKGYYQTELDYVDDDYKVDMYKLWKNKGVDLRGEAKL